MCTPHEAEVAGETRSEEEGARDEPWINQTPAVYQIWSYASAFRTSARRAIEASTAGWSSVRWRMMTSV